ncbi:MAG: chorismate lyase [Deltaproteobacteria bacterium]|nr:chorismate lyase [Deltaproteobacteria bacterium]
MKFSFTLLHGWNGEGEFSAALRGSHLQPHQLLLLLSDGSLTTHLETLYNSRLTVEIEESGSTSLDEEDAAFLGVSKDDEAVTRGTWLMVEGKKLVYAKTLLLTDRLEGRVVEDVSTSDVPLGRLLARSHPFLRKERSEMGAVTSPSVAGELDMAEDTPLWARRYLLRAQPENGGSSLRAMVMEIFAPELMGTPQIR